MSVKKLPNGRWQARWRDHHGDQRARSFPLKADAAAHEAKMLTDRDRGAFVSPTAANEPLASWAEQWLLGAMNLSQGTIDTYERDLQRYILPVLGRYKLRALSPERIEAFLAAELADELAPSSVHRHYRTLRRCLEVATERRILERNPCGPVQPPRVPRTEMMFLTAAQVEALAAKITVRYNAWTLVAAYGGPRWSELVGLRRRDVGDQGARLTIVEQLVRRADKTWDRTEPKTRAGRRVVTLPATVATALAGHLEEWSLPGRDGLVFPNQGGRALNGPSFRGSVFLPACIKAGIATPIEPTPAGEKIRYEGAPRVHDLRHTAAALMVLAGAHPKAMQVRMGHSSIMVTLDRYGHLFPEMDAELAVRLDELRPASGLHLVA